MTGARGQGLPRPPPAPRERGCLSQGLCIFSDFVMFHSFIKHIIYIIGTKIILFIMHHLLE